MPQGPAPVLSTVFQADTGQTPDHIAECVYKAYRGRPTITIGDIANGGKAITVSGASGIQAVLQFERAGEETHVTLRQDKALSGDAFGLIKQARVCGAMMGS